MLQQLADAEDLSATKRGLDSQLDGVVADHQDRIPHEDRKASERQIGEVLLLWSGPRATAVNLHAGVLVCLYQALELSGGAVECFGVDVPEQLPLILAEQFQRGGHHVLIAEVCRRGNEGVVRENTDDHLSEFAPLVGHADRFHGRFLLASGTYFQLTLRRHHQSSRRPHDIAERAIEE
ncbi:hypothetical protein [Rhodococcus jostii]|uniref:hypothetical protein n=1 Tax=Rhodococcus jostii TaxID=132919 RepID=UPI00115F7F70|nr:hypothetical protein [Rhodococcus jostii]